MELVRTPGGCWRRCVSCDWASAICGCPFVVVAVVVEGAWGGCCAIRGRTEPWWLSRMANIQLLTVAVPCITPVGPVATSGGDDDDDEDWLMLPLSVSVVGTNFAPSYKE